MSLHGQQGGGPVVFNHGGPLNFEGESGGWKLAMRRGSDT